MSIHPKINELSIEDLKKTKSELYTLGYSDCEIRKARKQNGISLIKRKKVITPELYSKIKKYIHKYRRATIREVANHFNLTFEQVPKILYAIRYDSIINFNIIDNPDKKWSYTLGLFAADGHISKSRNSVSISQNVNDIPPVLPYLCSAIKWNLYCNICHGYNKLPLIKLEIADARLYNKLSGLGFVNKSFIFPDITTYLQKENYIYFLRGFLDGDGCIYENVINFYGQRTCNWDNFIHLLNLIDIKPNIYFSKHASVVKIQRKYEILKFIHVVYNNEDNIYFPRKFKKARYFRDNFSYNLR